MKQLFKPGFAGIVLLMAIILGVVGSAIKLAESRIEQAVRQNFVAASLLARLQLEGERMRRYEKEMFIYAAAPTNRNKYVGEFDAASKRLLDLLNEAAAPSSRAFTDAERKEILGWIEAASFYGHEFSNIANKANSINLDTLPNDQRLSLSTKLNGDIKEGKDHFAKLLTGSSKMREAKERHSLQIGEEIDNVFRWLMLTITGIAVAVIALIGWLTVKGHRAAVGGGHPVATPSFR
jgi:hypothetical protein